MPYAPRLAVPRTSGRWPPAMLGLILVALTLCTFWPVLRCGFIALDDPVYVTANPHVSGGLRLGNITWAWTTLHGGLWIPLTWLSLMLDAQIYGLHAWGFHLTNLLLHSANVGLLFLFLQRATGAVRRSFLAAAVVAVHPIFVESVTWVTERKDVLSIFFGLLALLCYTAYACGQRKGYLGALILFSFSLMAKPLLVTFPLLLLLLDYWPLERWAPAAATESPTPGRVPRPIAALVWEKLPFLGLAGAAAIVTLVASGRQAYLVDLDDIGVGARCANAARSYCQYLKDLFWPVHLAAHYPYPRSWPAAVTMLTVAILLAITVLAIRRWRRWPWFIVGWLWFLVALLPNIGLVQAGAQARADRFVYLPAWGIVLLVCWSLPAALWERPFWRHRFLAGAGALGLLLALGTYVQIGYWNSTLRLYQHALDVTTDNLLVEMDVGTLLAQQNDAAGAQRHFAEAVRINPASARAQAGLGLAQLAQGHSAEALPNLQRAVELAPDMAEAHNGLGIALALTGQKDLARMHFAAACRLAPTNERYQRNLQRTAPPEPATQGAPAATGR